MAVLGNKTVIATVMLLAIGVRQTKGWRPQLIIGMKIRRPKARPIPVCNWEAQNFFSFPTHESKRQRLRIGLPNNPVGRVNEITKTLFRITELFRPLCNSLFQKCLGFLQTFSHLIERVSQIRNFIFGLNRHALGQFASRNRVDGVQQFPNWPEDFTRQRPRQHHRTDNRCQKYCCHERHRQNELTAHRLLCGFTDRGRPRFQIIRELSERGRCPTIGLIKQQVFLKITQIVFKIPEDSIQLPLRINRLDLMQHRRPLPYQLTSGFLQEPGRKHLVRPDSLSPPLQVNDLNDQAFVNSVAPKITAAKQDRLQSRIDSLLDHARLTVQRPLLIGFRRKFLEIQSVLIDQWQQRHQFGLAPARGTDFFCPPQFLTNLVETQKYLLSQLARRHLRKMTEFTINLLDVAKHAYR